MVREGETGVRGGVLERTVSPAEAVPHPAFGGTGIVPVFVLSLPARPLRPYSYSNVLCYGPSTATVFLKVHEREPASTSPIGAPPRLSTPSWRRYRACSS